MGIIRARAKMMLDAKVDGVSFASTLTLGRQKNNMTMKELSDLKITYNIIENENEGETLIYRSFADTFFSQYLGVKKLTVIDYSDYENADVIHDLNYSVPKSLKETFDVVIDGGTLEHIFNFPIAIKNCMNMVKNGGSLFIFSMANNHCGHGFYQFSPELFFRIFEESNGFEIKKVILVKHPFPGAELSQKQECYKVIDPKLIGRRSSLVTKSPLGIMVHAKKIDSKTIFSTFPNQSDYKVKWSNKSNLNITTVERSKTVSLFKIIYKNLPLRLRLWLSGSLMLRKYNLNADKNSYTYIGNG